MSFDVWASDIRYAVRMMRRTPALTCIIVLTLAIGIGANTAVFSVAEVAVPQNRSPIPIRNN